MEHRYVFGLVLLVGLMGCTMITVISGPRVLAPGDVATYVVSLGASDVASDVLLYVAADVPASWVLLSNSYDATINGLPVAGSGTVVSNPYAVGMMPAPGDGHQRIWIEGGPFDTILGDNGLMTLGFAVVDVPHGEFAVRFWFISDADPTGSIGNGPASVIVNRGSRPFPFAGALSVLQGALEYNFGIAASPDGRGLFLGGFLGPDMSVFDRDPLTGELVHLQTLQEPAMDGVTDLVVDPGSSHVYGVEGVSLAVFERDQTTSLVSRIQLLQDGMGGVAGLMGAIAVAISPDGSSVYVAAYSDDAVSVFSRDQVTGELSFVEAQFNGTGGVQGIDEPMAVVVSPDGTSVYSCGSADDAVAVFARGAGTGALTHVQTVWNNVGGVEALDEPRSMAVSPDGSHLYVAAQESHSVAVFSRDPVTGELVFVEAEVEGVGGVAGLFRPVHLTISSDGAFVFVAAQDSLVVFGRDPSTGELAFVNAEFQGDGGVNRIPIPYKLAVSPDSADLFYGSYEWVSVFSSRIFADGFESGDPSGWR